MRKRWLITVVSVAAIYAGLSQLPLRWFGPNLDINGKTPTYGGTVWNGFMTGTDAGTISIDSSILRMLSGNNPVHITGGPAGLSLNAEAGLSGLRSLNVQGSMKALALRDPRVGSVNGNFRLDIPDMKLKEVCEYANGEVWTDFLAQNAARLQWQGPELAGPVRCEEGNIHLELSGKDDFADINADIIVKMDGLYQADISVSVAQSIDRFAGPVLMADGFQKSGNAYILTEQGKWQ